jgi:phosphate transport system permease protein
MTTKHPPAALGVGRLPARRFWANKLTTWTVGLGGGAVIGAITLIFAYLLWVVAPIFAFGDIEAASDVNVVEREPLLVDVSENGDVYLRISTDGIFEFYDAHSGEPIAAFNLGSGIRQVQRVYPTVDLYAIVNEQGQLTLVNTQYIVSFIDGVRKLTPRLEYPYTNNPILLDGPASSIDAIDVHLNDNELVIATSIGNRLSIRRYRNIENGAPLPTVQQVAVDLPTAPFQILLGPRNQWVYTIGANGELDVIGIRSLNRIERLYQGQLLAGDSKLTAIGSVLGRYSLLIADDQGTITQWGILNNNIGYRMEALREFELEQPTYRLIAEPRRKGFAAIAADGTVTLLYPTSKRQIADLQTSLSPDTPMAISPRSDVLISANSSHTLTPFQLDNKHPEISLSTLWGKIWYEGYDEPIYSWQSSSADNDFEPKFSLTPLAFGTFKAAFYALLFAVPVAIMGAVYTAYFMAPAMRAWVKPGIEIMAALPTVILGFIGGLWLAPIIEANLSSVLSGFVLLPVGLFIFAIGWSQLPDRIAKPFGGWYGLMVTPLILLMGYLAYQYGPVMESQFFGGDSREWFREVLGLSYDQRNALIVGIVMGLAVIPTIFSITEDAIYGVPQHLINGSLALGATPWQTLVRVVILTASPGIFSAVMIGMGRAVGETMIVLMATGNTPIMDFNIFEGMRTFAANIAVELPESEVDSSHYRILFLAALVLFVLTFIFNTFAEVVRQRLRTRYGSL